MKCEKCERDLIGDSVICNGCGHDSSLRRESESHRPHPTTSAIHGVGAEANLIRFPRSANQSFTHPDDEADATPVWRNEVRERVRQFRQQRPELPFDDHDSGDGAAPSQNPIVEAALKRLNKAPGFSESRSVQGSHYTGEPAPSRAERFNGPGSRGSAVTGLRRETAELPTQDLQEDRGPAARLTATRLPTPTTGKATGSSVAQESTKPTRSLQALNPPLTAALWDRTLAGLFDFMLIAVACVPLYSIHSITGLKFGRSAAYTVVGIAIWMTFLYQIWTMLLAGRTCGMAWRHLRVVDAENRHPLFPQWRLFVRSICGTVSLLLPPLNIVVIWATGNQAGLADILSRTTVVQTHVSQSTPASVTPA